MNNRIETVLGATAAALTGLAVVAGVMAAFNDSGAPAAQKTVTASPFTPAQPHHGERSDKAVYPAGLIRPVRPHDIVSPPINALPAGSSFAHLSI
jgi:hypothetical protein